MRPTILPHKEAQRLCVVLAIKIFRPHHHLVQYIGQAWIHHIRSEQIPGTLTQWAPQYWVVSPSTKKEETALGYSKRCLHHELQTTALPLPQRFCLLVVNGGTNNGLTGRLSLSSLLYTRSIIIFFLRLGIGKRQGGWAVVWMETGWS